MRQQMLHGGPRGQAIRALHGVACGPILSSVFASFFNLFGNLFLIIGGKFVWSPSICDVFTEQIR